MKDVLTRWSRPTQRKRLFFFLLADACLIVLSLTLSFYLRLDFHLPSPYGRLLLTALPSFLVIKLMSFAYMRLYQISWRFVSLRDVSNIVKAVALSSFSLGVALFLFRSTLFLGFPRSVIAIDALLTLVFMCTLRIAKRIAVERIHHRRETAGRARAVVIGAGNTGEMILRDMQRQGAAYIPVAFVDDHPNRRGTYLHGVRVMGGIEDLARVVRATGATAVLIAIPSLGHLRLKEIYRLATDVGVEEIKIVPRLYEMDRPQVRVRDFEEIRIEDLIGRTTVHIDQEGIRQVIEDRSVLVTGAAGSIGQELVYQICALHPRTLVLFDVDETELFYVEHQLRRRWPDLISRMRFVVGDVRDVHRMEQVFRLHRPSVVFHAAAYKHVPMMEQNVTEAVKVNVVGTMELARAAVQAGCQRFVLISSDKAVNPTSVMGATKRIAEHICRAYQCLGGTKFVAVRFGNVLGSRGSVLPLFLDQIKRGEALTVTHRDMKRYFMTIPEAVSLVLQAGTMGEGGEVMVLDMGDPVRIIDIAEELIRLHQLVPYEDVDIRFIGPRPGEKMFEELLLAEEGTVATKHKQIYVARTVDCPTVADMELLVARMRLLFEDATISQDGAELRALIRDAVPQFQDERCAPVPFDALSLPTQTVPHAS